MNRCHPSTVWSPRPRARMAIAVRSRRAR
jgi:hypothetical protein